MNVAGIVEEFSDKSVLAESRPNLFRRNQEAVSRVGGPRKRKVSRSRFSSGDLLEDVPTTRLEDPVDLPIERLFVRDVHANILHPDHIKRIVGKRQGESIALVHFDSVVKAGQPIQQYRTGAEIGRQFEAVDA